MNVAIIIGNLTRDPEVTYTPNTQMAVCKFTVAINRPRRNGEDAGADYPRVTVFGNQAESCGRYLHKGSPVAVKGHIQTGSYKNREGITVYTTDIVAERVKFLSSGQNNGQGGYDSQQPNNGYSGGYQNGGYDDGYGQQPSYGQGYQPQSFQPAEQQTMGYEAQGFNDLPDSFQAAEDDIPF